MFRLLALPLLAAGCAGTVGVAPATAIRAYLAAADPHAAYQLLSQPARAAISEEDFAARWRTDATERKAQAGALTALSGRPAAQHARALWSDSKEVDLVMEPAGWRLQSPRMVAAGAASPEDAVRRFAEAMERHDLDGLLDLLTDPVHGLFERELAERLTRLKAALHKEIQVDGSHARIRFDERYYLELRLENGRWRVSDFN